MCDYADGEIDSETPSPGYLGKDSAETLSLAGSLPGGGTGPIL